MANHQHNRKRLSPWVILGGIAGLLLLLALTPVIVFVAWSNSHSREVKRRIEVMKARGEPVESAELAASFPLPKGAEDVTSLWIAGLDPLDTPEYQAASANLPFVGTTESSAKGLSSESLGAAESFLSKYQLSLDRFHEAAKRGGHGRFPVDYSQGFSTLLPYTQKTRSAARLLRLEFAIELHHTRTEGASQAILTLFLLPRAVEHEPILVSQFVAIAVNTVASEALAEKLCTAPLPRETLVEIQQIVRSRSPAKGIGDALLGERAMGYTTMRNPKLMGSDNPGIPAFQSDIACYLEFMERIHGTLDEGFPRCIDAYQVIEGDLKKRIADPRARITMTFTSLMLPATGAAFEATARLMATLQALDAGIAAELYRRDTGALPKSLSELVPTYLPRVPVDPQTGNPMIYKVAAEGFTIYGFGKNRLDDGGTLDQKQTDVGLFFPLK